MLLANSVELWEMNHPNEFYLDDIDINSTIEKTALFDYLYSEYKTMHVIEPNSDVMHERVKTFFVIHKWNIDKLCETLMYEYDPLNNVNLNTQSDKHRDLDRGEVTGEQWTEDEIKKLDSNDIRTLHNTINGEGSNSGTSGDHNVHLVSAYNEPLSPSGSDYDPDKLVYHDTEKNREIDSGRYSNSGTSTSTTDENVTTIKNVGEDNDRTGTKDIEVVEDETERTVETVTQKGNKGQSFQSLVEEERMIAQFNIYKWISKHFCKELLIAIW